MITWLMANWGTIVAALVLIGIVAGVIISMVKDKKKGKSPCGCDCGHCSASCACHKNR